MHVLNSDARITVTSVGKKNNIMINCGWGCKGAEHFRSISRIFTKFPISFQNIWKVSEIYWKFSNFLQLYLQVDEKNH